MLAYNVETNVILVDALQSRHNRHRIAAYDRIMSCLKSGGHGVDLQVLENKSIKAYNLDIEDKRNYKFQLVPLNVHQRNAAKGAIQTLKHTF